MTSPLKITVERWLCPHCRRENSTEKNAAECCLCSTCNKNLATAASWGSGKPDICAPCQARKRRESARGEVRTAQARVYRARTALADAERDLVRAQTAFAILHTPKKPKAPQPESETQEKSP